jgi:hypothetical protein
MKIVKVKASRRKGKFVKAHTRIVSKPSMTVGNGGKYIKSKHQGGFSDDVFTHDVIAYLNDLKGNPGGWLGYSHRTKHLDRVIAKAYSMHPLTGMSLSNFVTSRYGRHLGDLLTNDFSKTLKGKRETIKHFFMSGGDSLSTYEHMKGKKIVFKSKRIENIMRRTSGVDERTRLN